MKRAVFPGSFDPITLGHTDVIDRALRLFDELIVAVGINVNKQYMFDVETRVRMIEAVYGDESKVKVDYYTGLTVDYARKKGAEFILRGLRNPTDFEFEKSIAQTNRMLGGVDTVFILTSPETSHISSSIVRDILRNGGRVDKLVPAAVLPILYKK
ncbi:MAG: pantetheine-phosphate adenylyltransferase [Chlorobi bacterium]|nr:pantetheine-phosphate adenylyltransferase [Chlorobiota bacterium]